MVGTTCNPAMYGLFKKIALLVWAGFILSVAQSVSGQGTRLLRQPSISGDRIAFTHGGDIWTTDLNGKNLRRITSTAAFESEPQFSPDGQWIAFSSNRSGGSSVYIVSRDGGQPMRLTWHPSPAIVRGWTPDGSHILYASTRETAPSSYNRLWVVSKEGGPSELLARQWGFDGSHSPDGKKIALDRMSRWESEFRGYRGGQNTPLIILDLQSFEEILLPHEGSTDIQPLWIGGKIYFLSDRDWTSNVWSYDVGSGKLAQVTHFKDTDVKSLNGNELQLIFEQNGYLHLLDLKSGRTTQLNIEVVGDFPWAETRWEDVTERARSVSLSPTGKRALMESRGEIFTVPVEHGDARNLTLSCDAADRNPLWSPNGGKIAWFSDKGSKGYALSLTDQDGLSNVETIPIGESKMAWEPAWSPDGKFIAFVDDDVRVRVIDLESKTVKTIDTGGNNMERGSMGLCWSPDSKRLAYAKSGSNQFRRIMVWSMENDKAEQLTDSFADSFSPSWDRDLKHLYFLASTDLALGSGWANTSSMQADPQYAAYVIVLREGEVSPFIPRSDEEEVKEEKAGEDKKDEGKGDEKDEMDTKDKTDDPDSQTGDSLSDTTDQKDKSKELKIDLDRIERRTIALPLPIANYQNTSSGPEGTVFISERKPGNPGLTLHKFDLKERKPSEFLSGIRQYAISADGKNILAQKGSEWEVSGTGGKSANGGKTVSVKLEMKLDRSQEWSQMFEEAWRYERDYFYDPGMHGRDWQAVHQRYSSLIPHIHHRGDLSYILDQMNGELSVGHSFVFGGDFPDVDEPMVGMLGADLRAENGRWKITRIYTTESWNPDLSSPLDRPGMKAKEGDYLVGINGKELTAQDNPFELLDGTRGKQTVLHLSEHPVFDSAWTEIAKPIESENALRQRAWVEDNRRIVNKLSNGRLAYVWVPNTGGSGFVNFNRYFFAQQDKEGAVIDERFNGGGLLDDYMVDLMTRSIRAAITNEVPNGNPFVLPAGILGPKVLLINERAGSGGDFFPWVFRQQKAGPLIGMRTWGGLVKSSVHYALVDGGALTAPDNAVFDPVNNAWIAENEGVSPDIEVRQDAKSLEQGKDPQLERAISELLEMIRMKERNVIKPPSFPKPAKN